MKMIQRATITVILCLMAVAQSHGQNQDADCQILREILAELRSMHEDIRVTETTQLLVAEMQMQQAVVNRATESADNAREKVDNVHRSQQQLANDLERAQEQLDKAINSDLKGQLSANIERLKSNVDLLKGAERDSNASSDEMQRRLQNAQDKLAGIEAELSAVIARLSPISK